MENYPFLNKAISQVVTRLRKESGYSQLKLAELSSIARVYLLQLEQGRFRPTLNSIYHIANGFGMPPQKLVELIEMERQKMEKEHDNSS